MIDNNIKETFMNEIEEIYEIVQPEYNSYYLYVSVDVIEAFYRPNVCIYVEKDGKVMDIYDTEKVDGYAVDMFNRVLVSFDDRLFDMLTEYWGGTKTKKYIEFTVRVTGTDEIEVLTILEGEENSVNFVDNQHAWLKRTFKDLSGLSDLYRMRSILDDPTDVTECKMSKNFLVKYDASLVNSRFHNNHVKLLANDEIKKYKKVLKKVFGKSYIPFLMTNVGSMFVYNKKDKTVYYCNLTYVTDFKVCKVTDTNIRYFIRDYVREISRVRFLFNFDLFEIPLRHDHLLYVQKDVQDEVKENYIAMDMGEVIKLLSVGL